MIKSKKWELLNGFLYKYKFKISDDFLLILKENSA